MCKVYIKARLIEYRKKDVALGHIFLASSNKGEVMVKVNRQRAQQAPKKRKIKQEPGQVKRRPSMEYLQQLNNVGLDMIRSWATEAPEKEVSLPPLKKNVKTSGGSGE
jgi:hypothetical protein